MIDYSQYNSIDGFFMGCTPFESILQATLDCLYEIQCIQLLNDYFPSLKEVILFSCCLIFISIILFA